MVVKKIQETYFLPWQYFFTVSWPWSSAFDTLEICLSEFIDCQSRRWTSLYNKYVAIRTHVESPRPKTQECDIELTHTQWNGDGSGCIKPVLVLTLSQIKTVWPYATCYWSNTVHIKTCGRVFLFDWCLNQVKRKVTSWVFFLQLNKNRLLGGF